MSIVEQILPRCVGSYEARHVANGYRVAVDALAEVGRLDLASHLQPLMDTHPVDRMMPHFDHWDGAGAASLEDLALVEKAMSIAYRAVGVPYVCWPCEITFESYGVSHSLTREQS